ncbi:L,D-transpeptidase family protein [Pedobacter cryoconitis]|nr:L,D-transpeptidase family protein [Pedobacter cryoconitis]
MKHFESYFFCKYIISITVIMLLVSSCAVKRPATTTKENVNTTNSTKNTDSLKKALKAAQLEEKLRAEFKDLLKSEAAGLPYPEMISKRYEKGEYHLVLVPRFLPDNQIQVLMDYLNHAGDHGLDNQQFSIADFKKQLDELRDFKSADTVKIHRCMAKLELSFINSLIRYSIALQYGIINPSKIYNHYAIPTLLPDSSFVTHIFEIRNLKFYLDSIQPKDKTYRALQKTLIRLEQDTIPKPEPPKIKLSMNKESKKNREKHSKTLKTAVKPVLSKEALDSLREQTRLILVVNMERLRWKNKPAGQKSVLVNIADFSLDVMENGKSTLHMNVCVGQPGDKQTPQLGSMISLVQINPVWNIPQSIARNEISKYAADDRYYLANNNIKTFKKGKLVRDTEAIDWASANIGEYSFQQQPGSKNSLGKIKFLFKNASSVYLHDTPVRTVFKQKMRAISHGCVRVEKPLDLASALFGKDNRYNQIKNGMASGYPRAKFIGLPQQVPIRLFYYTAWLNDKGGVQFAKDIYGLDPIVYQAMKTAGNQSFEVVNSL